MTALDAMHGWVSTGDRGAAGAPQQLQVDTHNPQAGVPAPDVLTRPPFFAAQLPDPVRGRGTLSTCQRQLTMHSLGHACSAAVRCAVTRRLNRQKPFAPLTLDAHIGGRRAAQSGDGDVASAAARGACETAAATAAAPALAATAAAAKAGEAQPARATALLLCRSCSAVHAPMVEALLNAGLGVCKELL